MTDNESFLYGYITAALWSSLDEHDEPLDGTFDWGNLSPARPRQ